MFAVRVLGSSSAMPAHGRHHPAQWVQHDGFYFLIDCGEGTQYQLLRYKLNPHKIQAILLSHLHADHVAGVGGLLTTLHMQGHQKPLYLWGPPGLRSFLEGQLLGMLPLLRYPIYVREVFPRNEKVLLWETARLRIYAFPLRHGVPTIGYLFQEWNQPRRPDMEKLSAWNIDSTQLTLLKQRGEILHNGHLIRWDEVSLPPPLPRSYAYCSDTMYAPEVVDFVSGVSMLYHESTFLSVHAERAQQTLHSTAQQAAYIAQKAGARQLIIGHFSARYKNLQPLLAEARSIFPETYLAEEGQTYPVP